MGVWERSLAGIAIANRNKNLVESFRHVLPDSRRRTMLGLRTAFDATFADPTPWRSASAPLPPQLANRGMKLLLDSCRNHVARITRWVSEHRIFYSRHVEDVSSDPASYWKFKAAIYGMRTGSIFPGSRKFCSSTRELGCGIRCLPPFQHAAQCDGIRCDMAMLLLNKNFERTLGQSAPGFGPPTEYGVTLIPLPRRLIRISSSIAEAYWIKSGSCSSWGFDFCYDKRSDARLEHDNAESVRLQLCADSGYQKKLLRFLEIIEGRGLRKSFQLRKSGRRDLTSSVPGARCFLRRSIGRPEKSGYPCSGQAPGQSLRTRT